MVKMPVGSEGYVIGLKNLALALRPNPNRLCNLYLHFSDSSRLGSKGRKKIGRGGEIGIRARLRISWSRDCAGSSPALGTKKEGNSH